MVGLLGQVGSLWNEGLGPSWQLSIGQNQQKLQCKKSSDSGRSLAGGSLLRMLWLCKTGSATHDFEGCVPSHSQVLHTGASLDHTFRGMTTLRQIVSPAQTFTFGGLQILPDEAFGDVWTTPLFVLAFLSFALSFWTWRWCGFSERRSGSSWLCSTFGLGRVSGFHRQRQQMETDGRMG